MKFYERKNCILYAKIQKTEMQKAKHYFKFMYIYSFIIVLTKTQ